MEVGAEGDAVEEGTLLAGGAEVEGFGGGGHEDCGVVAEDAGEDHDYGDGEEDPVAVVRVEWLVTSLIVVKDSGRGGTYNNWGSLWIVWIGTCAMVVASSQGEIVLLWNWVKCLAGDGIKTAAMQCRRCAGASHRMPRLQGLRVRTAQEPCQKDG